MVDGIEIDKNTLVKLLNSLTPLAQYNILTECGYTIENLRNKRAYKKEPLENTSPNENCSSEITTLNTPSNIDLSNGSINYISPYRTIIDSDGIAYKKAISPCCVHKNSKLCPIPNREKVFDSLYATTKLNDIFDLKHWSCELKSLLYVINIDGLLKQAFLLRDGLYEISELTYCEQADYIITNLILSTVSTGIQKYINRFFIKECISSNNSIYALTAILEFFDIYTTNYMLDDAIFKLLDGKHNLSDCCNILRRVIQSIEIVGLSSYNQEKMAEFLFTNIDFPHITEVDWRLTKDKTFKNLIKIIELYTDGSLTINQIENNYNNNPCDDKIIEKSGKNTTKRTKCNFCKKYAFHQAINCYKNPNRIC